MAGKTGRSSFNESARKFTTYITSRLKIEKSCQESGSRSQIKKLRGGTPGHIPVGVFIVNGRSGSMVDAPDRRDAASFTLPVRQKESRQCRKREGDVFQAGTRRDFRSRVRHADESDAVVLFVVCDEGDEVVAVGDGAF